MQVMRLRLLELLQQVRGEQAGVPQPSSGLRGQRRPRAGRLRDYLRWSAQRVAAVAFGRAWRVSGSQSKLVSMRSMCWRSGTSLKRG